MNGWSVLCIAAILIAALYKIITTLSNEENRNDNISVSTPESSHSEVHRGHSERYLRQTRNLPSHHEEDYEYSPFEMETGPVIYFANGEGRDKTFVFNYKKLQRSGTWRAYIEKSPDWNGRSQDGHSTHRHFDGTKGYVCWNSPVESLTDMQNISKVWADCIVKYIRTGETFG